MCKSYICTMNLTPLSGKYAKLLSRCTKALQAHKFGPQSAIDRMQLTSLFLQHSIPEAEISILIRLLLAYQYLDEMDFFGGKHPDVFCLGSKAEQIMVSGGFVPLARKERFENWYQHWGFIFNAIALLLNALALWYNIQFKC